MKKIKIMLLIFLMGISNALVAGVSEPKLENSTALNAEISRLMKQHFLFLEEEMMVDVKFTINGYGEIVVLSVKCEKPEVRTFIFQTLSNKKLKTNTYEEDKLYTVPVRLKP